MNITFATGKKFALWNWNW